MVAYLLMRMRTYFYNIYKGSRCIGFGGKFILFVLWTILWHKVIFLAIKEKHNNCITGIDVLQVKHTSLDIHSSDLAFVYFNTTYSLLWLYSYMFLHYYYDYDFDWISIAFESLTSIGPSDQWGTWTEQKSLELWHWMRKKTPTPTDSNNSQKRSTDVDECEMQKHCQINTFWLSALHLQRNEVVSLASRSLQIYSSTWRAKRTGHWGALNEVLRRRGA